MPTITVRPGDNRNLQYIADILGSAKKVVAISGAGVSTSCGIPDFRSENGLYTLIQDQYNAAKNNRSSSKRHSRTYTKHSKLPSNMKGKDLFDSMLFKDQTSTEIFYMFIAALRKRIQEVASTSMTHKFIRVLRDGNKLVRCYTQNIDGLEAREGLCDDLNLGKGNRARFFQRNVGRPRAEVVSSTSEMDGGCEVVQLHGDIDTLRCTICQEICPWDKRYEQLLLAGEVPICHFCSVKHEDRMGRGKRGLAIGNLRPNIVLYGEEHPAADLLGSIITNDIRLGPDTLIILGTSLKVHGLKYIVKEFSRAVHAKGTGKGTVIYVNRTKAPESVWEDVIDYWVEMDCDDWVMDVKKRRGDLWMRQTKLAAPVEKRLKQSNGKRPRDTDESTAQDGKKTVTPKKRRCVASNTSSMGLSSPLSEVSIESQNISSPKAPRSQSKDSTETPSIPPKQAVVACVMPSASNGQIPTPPDTRSKGRRDNFEDAKEKELSVSPCKRKSQRGATRFTGKSRYAASTNKNMKRSSFVAKLKASKMDEKVNTLVISGNKNQL
ncbi:MAG: hypothetical protein M1834_007454 [Cirrosporium novae-zelandiae]|nr:MAG: hypothetical protein M1834_007454 [Cirrosporium novae-zelandiae]